MEKFNRGERRAQVERLKKNRKGYFGYDRPYTLGADKMSVKELGCVVNTTTPCSCMMCGNPRKWFGERTIQEQRLMQDISE